MALTPPSFNPINQSSMTAQAGVINGLLGILLPVGSIITSMLNETQFQSLLPTSPNPATWVLADGRDVTGSGYNTVTSNTNIPDLRGIFVRGCNNGGSAAGTRADGNQNPDGSLSPGTFTTDKFGSHSHVYAVAAPNVSVGSGTAQNPAYAQGNTNTGNSGGNETAPKNVSVNYFIRIN